VEEESGCAPVGVASMDKGGTVCVSDAAIVICCSQHHAAEGGKQTMALLPSTQEKKLKTIGESNRTRNQY
jgi:hypothetical protein